ncbi:MAG: redoxin domain-containing protein, partial [Bacteroidota bacterium]
TFWVIRTIKRMPSATGDSAPPLPTGTVVADVSMDRFSDNETVSLSTYPQHAKALVFLGSKCPKCKAKLPELRASMAKTQNLGVMIWIVSVEKRRRIKNFLRDEVLLDATLRTNQDTYDYLNPQSAFPYYLFIDAENTVQAEGMLGDENWMNFIEQLEQEG